MERSRSLQDKVAIVTGASSGIGRATAQCFSDAGAKLVVAGRKADDLASLVRAIEQRGGQATAVTGDLRDEATAQALVSTALDRFGGLDIAFNNAGVAGAMGPLWELTPQAWHETLETNLTAAFLCARHQLPAILKRGGGSLIFTSSFVGQTVGFPGMAAYAASKAGLVGMAQVLAAELGPRGVRVNVLLPGGTDTPSNVVNAADTPPETRAFVEGLHALKRLARPEEIAQAALFLASEASSFVTGSTLRVDGGISITRG